ncbi:MAG: hypothetical protein CME21_03865 [Gemmatimonadetes bacterium]|jgi:thioredoxin-related protein|nr:hypothetical protein [Gemmatimonadota bacterium]HCK11177.1 hypothetical protein [Candidatus Latescibacterota bacterium]
MRLMRSIRAIVSGIAFVSLFGGSVEAEWLTYPRGLVRADSTDTLVMVEVYTDWCAYCKKLDRRVLSRDDVKAVLKQHYTTVKLDAENDTPMARIGDETLNSRKLARKYGVTTIPTCLILAPNGKLLKKLVGYHPPEDFLAFLRSPLASQTH